MAVIRSLFLLSFISTACVGQPFNYRISTIAGINPLNDGGPATSAYLLYPRGVALDPDGNLYIADYGNHRIRKVSTDGTITTVAGTGVWGLSEDGGPAVSSRLAYPANVCYDRGDLVFSEGFRIRRVTADGAISTVVTNVGPVYGLAVDSERTIYFSEGTANRVRKVTRAGRVSLVAGTGQTGFSGDLGPAVEARLNFPQAVAVDNSGNVYIGDGLRVRKVDPSGIITSLYGRDSSQINDPLMQTIYGLHWTPDGLYVAFYWYVSRVSGNTVQRMTNGTIGFSGNGPVLDASFDYLQGITSGPDGAIYLADFWNSRVRRMRGSTVQTVAGRDRFGGDGGSASEAIIFAPYRVIFDPSGGIVLSDTRNERIRKIGTDGNINTIIGTGTRGFSGDGTSNPLTSRISFPVGLAFNPSGNLIFADSLNSRLRSLSPASAVQSIAGTSFTGFGGEGGPALAALLNSPRGIAIDRGGNIYVADTSNHRVRRINPGGLITTVAGTGTAGFSGDGGPGNQARLSSPDDVAISPDGDIYIADASNYRIRKISANGTISTFAGNGTLRRTGDNVPATAASLQRPVALAFDAAGTLFIAEANGDSVVCVTKQGVFYRIAGNGDTGFGGDGGSAMEAALNNPNGIAIDSRGNILIADTDNSRLRQLTPLTVGRIAPLSGDGQTVRPGARLAAPLVARVTSSDNIPLRDIPVTFAVTSGQAVLSASTVRTDSAGGASVGVTAGNTLGALTIRATAQGATPIVFTLTVEDDSIVPVRITQVLSGGPSGAALTALSSNMWIDVYANNLQASIATIAPNEIALPTRLGGFCVEVSGVQAGLRGIDSRRISAVVPALEGAEARIRVIAGCGSATPRPGDTVTLPLQAATPELLAAGEAGTQYDVSLTAESDARPGGSITLLAIGVGAETAVSLRIGEIVVPGEAAPSAAITGVYNITLKIPDDLPAGRYPLVLNAAGIDSPAGAMLTVR